MVSISNLTFLGPEIVQSCQSEFWSNIFDLFLAPILALTNVKIQLSYTMSGFVGHFNPKVTSWKVLLPSVHTWFLKNQVGKIKFDELDFYCLCSLQKSISKLIFAVKNLVRRTWFFKLDFSKIKYRWIERMIIPQDVL